MSSRYCYSMAHRWCMNRTSRVHVAVAGRCTKAYLVWGVSPVSRSASSQTSGASRRWSRQSWAGVTRRATQSTDHRRTAPRLRQLMRRHRGCAAATAATVDEGTSSANAGRVRGRPWRPPDGHTRRGRPRNTVCDDDIPHRIREPLPVQLGAKQAGVAILRVRQHARHGEAARARLAEQGQRQAPFLLKADAGRNPRALPGGRRQPCRGQVERRPEQVAAYPGPQCRRDRDLTVGDLPQGPAVLAAHPNGVWPLLGKARAVDDQQPGAFGQHRPQAAPDLLGVPRGVGDEVLERLIGPGLGDPRQHRLHRFACAVAEQPLNVPAQRQVLRAMSDALLEGFEPPHQAEQLGNSATVGHYRAGYRTSRKSTMSSK